MGIRSFFTLILGIALIYWIRRRKFNRRNMAGVEEFQSFEQATFIRIAEKLGIILGYIMIFFSIFYGCLMKPYMERASEKKNAGNTQTEQRK